jgi:large repetitive protein
VTFTAVVTSKLGSPPDGEAVTFKEGTTVLGTGALSGGMATFTTSTLPVGTNAIKAVYGGDVHLAASTSNTAKQVVN